LKSPGRRKELSCHDTIV